MGGEFSVLTLNLHGYEEEDPQGCLDRVARAILERRPDVIVLQECVQHREAPVVARHQGVAIRSDNQVAALVRRLAEGGRPHDWAWDWAHYGWERWEEGCAILSPHGLRAVESRYVSRSQSTDAWRSRRPVSAVVDLPQGLTLPVFSVHLGWWDDAEEPFEAMLERLLEWQSEVAPNGVCLTAGDFNLAAESPGYHHLVRRTGWFDAWKALHPGDPLAPTIGADTEGWASGQGERIDYTFLPAGTAEAVYCERLFTPEVYGRVSDHLGVLTTYRID